VPSNAIVAENQLTGTPPSVWSVGNGNTTIQGFATDISVDQGQTVTSRSRLANAPYHIDITGWATTRAPAARLVTTIPNAQVLGRFSPAAHRRPTGLIDAGNWADVRLVGVPRRTSGLYFARFTRDDTGGASSGVFRRPRRRRRLDLLFQTADTLAGLQLLGRQQPLRRSPPAGRTRSATTDPSPSTRSAGGLGDYSSPLHAEYPMIRWLEPTVQRQLLTDIDTTLCRLPGGTGSTCR